MCLITWCLDMFSESADWGEQKGRERAWVTYFTKEYVHCIERKGIELLAVTIIR